MKTIKIIDLYILIANKEFDKLPKKIKYGHTEFEYDENEKNYHSKDWWADLLLTNEISKHLNDEVEILEDEKKIPEKLTDILRVDDLIPPVDENMYKIWEQTIKNQNKVNEILDYLETKGE